MITACLFRRPAARLLALLVLLVLGPVLAPSSGILASLSSTARAQMAVPPLQGRINHLTATLTPPQRAALERKLAQFEPPKGPTHVIQLPPSHTP